MANASLIGPYSAPPVLEAVVQFVLAEPLDEAEFRKTSNRMKREYSTYEELESVNANVNFESRTAEFSSVPNRKMTSEDQADTFSMSMESFAWGRLAPYEGWESFLSRLISNYEAIKAILGYRKLSRVGVRYINRIDVPTNEIEDVIPYEDYLEINLNLPPEIYKLRNYAWRLECSIDGFTAIAQSASIEPVIPDMGSFLLDLDIVAINDIPPKFEGVIDLLNRMRNAKNRMFEMSITDKARESFSA